MKHFLKQLSWMFAFVLFFTSIVSTGIPVYAVEVITIGENTDEVIVAGTNVKIDGWMYNIHISYYESADSDTVLYEDIYADTIGSNEIATKPYAWHVTFVKKMEDNSTTQNPTAYYFKAYPDTSIEDVPVSTQMTLPAGTILTTTGAAINVSVYVGDKKLKDYATAGSKYTLPTQSQLYSDVGVLSLNIDLESKGYHLPDLTRLFYTVELTAKSASPYSLKLTLLPTVEVTFNQNTGTPDLAGTKMYATQNATIDSTKLPSVSRDDVDFYGWKIGETDKYVYLKNITDDNKSSLALGVSGAVELKAMYKENKPTFSLDLENKKVKNLFQNRTYAYPPYEDYTSYTIETVADANCEFSYETLESFESQAKLRLNSENTGVFVNSDYVSLKHSTPNKPVTENTQTTARVTNTSEFAGCEFAIRATSDDSDLSWGTSSTFSGLTPQTEYKIYAKHKADENGFESDQAESAAFTTLAVKAVSNDAPNGVTIEDITVQAHTNSAIEPVLVITDGDKTLAQGTDYTASYTNNINVGTATATVTFMNSYSGTMTKNFDIGYIVSFDGNGGTGAMSNVSVINGEQYTLPACTFTAPANKEFKAWNIGGTEYAAGANCTITDNTTITAVWMDLEKAKTPAISPNGGTFSGSQTVTLTTETTGAVIYYTTNGTAPTTGSTIYSTPFTISNSVTVKAIAVKGGMNNSDIASASFTRRSSDSGTSKSTNKSTNSTPTPTPTPILTPTLTLTPTPTPTLTQTPTYTALTSGNANTPNSNNELVLTIGKKEAKAFGLDKTNDVVPIIRKDRTMFPVRFVAENLDAEVIWDSKKREVTIKGKNEKSEDVTILIYIDSDFAYVNGKNVKLDSHAFIENGRTYTPIRFVAENLGASVEWIGAEQKVVITKKATN